MQSIFTRCFLALPLWWRHAMADVRGSHHTFPADSLARIQTRVEASERLHTGQICICVETHLPRSYLWRFVRQGTSVQDLTRQRALSQFAKQRVWDTEHNNGVLIYVLLAERAIQVVADRGVNECVQADHWQSVVMPMQQAFAQDHFESGLEEAVNAVSELLQLHFPISTRQVLTVGVSPTPVNELPDAPVML